MSPESPRNWASEQRVGFANFLLLWIRCKRAKTVWRMEMNTAFLLVMILMLFNYCSTKYSSISLWFLVLFCQSLIRTPINTNVNWGTYEHSKSRSIPLLTARFHLYNSDLTVLTLNSTSCLILNPFVTPVCHFLHQIPNVSIQHKNMRCKFFVGTCALRKCFVMVEIILFSPVGEIQKFRLYLFDFSRRSANC